MKVQMLVALFAAVFITKTHAMPPLGQCSNNGEFDDNLDNCVCDDGYQGDGFECRDIDECATMCGGCDDLAVCTNNVGSFVCTCDAGYDGDGKEGNCNDIDECSKDDTNDCDASINAVCMNTEGSFVCVCDVGFVGDGVTFCDDIDECKEGCAECQDNASCKNTPGSFTCGCDPGFESDGVNCVDIDECKEDVADVCDASINAVCMNTEGSFVCVCKVGYVGDGETFCDEINECEACGEVVLCGEGTCVNTPGSFMCF